MGTLVWLDRMEALGTLRLAQLTDCTPLIGQPERLREHAAQDGFLFLRALLPTDLVLPLRHCILDYARGIGWLNPAAPNSEGRAVPGKRIGYYQDPDWVNLQVHVQNRPEMWALGEAPAIHRVLHCVESRSSYLCLSTANTCRVFSAHPDMATQPHQDANYVRVISQFWTAWIPLGDCPRHFGPLALLAGSHHGGLQPHSGQGIVDGGVNVRDDAVWSTADFRCGDVVLFRPYTLHRSLPNCSGDRLRLSADFRYGFWADGATVDWRAASLVADSHTDAPLSQGADGVELT
jgi:hypothetical protein